MWLFLLFVAVPMIEIALFVKIGGFIGLWPTLAIVVGTAMLGSYLLRLQGALAMNQLRESFNKLEDPSEPLAHGAMILVAAVLLLTPGFFTDTVGLLLLLPPVRAAVFRYLRSHIKVQTFTTGAPPQQRFHETPDVIDGEFEEIDAEKGPAKGPSGWTRH